MQQQFDAISQHKVVATLASQKIRSFIGRIFQSLIE